MNLMNGLRANALMNFSIEDAAVLGSCTVTISLVGDAEFKGDGSEN